MNFMGFDSFLGGIASNSLLDLVMFNKLKKIKFVTTNTLINGLTIKPLFITTFSLSSFFRHRLEPRKEKTDSSNGNNNALSPQEQHQQHQQQQQANYQQMMAQERGEPMIKPERPNSLGPKLSKRINFYHDNCK